ncbi:MAG TPA: GNAT family N-acetyltransferase [Chthonomonadaceae bacterium]|nr:GNAT family N-acetyltransferase [Chthonomonadaceae bacterium]
MTLIHTPSGRLALRAALRPGDLAAILAAHVREYVDGRAYSLRFEAYVAQGLAAFVLDSDPARERVWLAEDADGGLAGCVGIVDAGGGRAQLRWLLVAPPWRGKGVGAALLREAVAFTRACGYRSVTLRTVSELEEAANLYRREGFELVEEKPNTEWAARTLIEQRYERDLTPDGSPAPCSPSPFPGRRLHL